MDRPAESGPYLLASLAELMHGKNLVYSGYLKPVIMRQGNDVLLHVNLPLNPNITASLYYATLTNCTKLYQCH